MRQRIRPPEYAIPEPIAARSEIAKEGTGPDRIVEGNIVVAEYRVRVIVPSNCVIVMINRTPCTYLAILEGLFLAVALEIVPVRLAVIKIVSE